MSNWQPIETLPEGVHVLLWFPKGERGIGGMETATVYREPDGPSRCGYAFWTHGGPNAGSEWDTDEAPTLWMHIEPPVTP